MVVVLFLQPLFSQGGLYIYLYTNTRPPAAHMLTPDRLTAYGRWLRRPCVTPLPYPSALRPTGPINIRELS